MEKSIKSDEENGRSHKLLLSIPGIGAKTAASLMAELPDISLLENARQLAAYAGTTPRIFQSGTWVGVRCRILTLPAESY